MSQKVTRRQFMKLFNGCWVVHGGRYDSADG